MRPFIHSLDRCLPSVRIALHRIGCDNISCRASSRDRSIDRDWHGQAVGSSMCNQYQPKQRGTRAGAGSSLWAPWNISGGHAWNGDEERLAGALGARWNVSLGHGAELFFGENELDLYACCTSSRPCLSLYYLQKSNIASSWNLMAGYVPNSCAVGRITEHLMLKRCFFDVSVAAHKPEQNRSHKPDK